jgi:hypothetical protein
VQFLPTVVLVYLAAVAVPCGLLLLVMAGQAARTRLTAQRGPRPCVPDDATTGASAGTSTETAAPASPRPRGDDAQDGATQRMIDPVVRR